MKVEALEDLIALQRCLVEAKFHSDPQDQDITLSPIVSRLVNECADEIELLMSEGHNDLTDLKDWRQAKNHPELVDNLVSVLRGRDMTDTPTELKTNILIDALAPFIASQDMLEELKARVYD